MAIEVREEAIVLGSVDYGDSDRIVTLFTKGLGKVGAFARGARVSKRRFAGALEPFTSLEVRLQQRRGDLYVLASCSIQDAFVGLRGSLEAIGYAGHATELCREFCKEREPHERLHEILLDYLRELSSGRVIPEALLAFELAAVGEAGLAPRLDACARCGGSWGGESLPFDPGHGGVLCAGCIGAAHPDAFPVRGQAVTDMQILQQRRDVVRIEDPERRQAVRRIIRRYTHSILGRSPRSLDVLHQLGIEA